MWGVGPFQQSQQIVFLPLLPVLLINTNCVSVFLETEAQQSGPELQTGSMLSLHDFDLPALSCPPPQSQ